ncbi:MAG: hypothetical protein JWM81_1032 [Candidatus Saccharibacteria bacterium]|nr:hypothetical protein [Candidatus Saccharibacteria bacterium]
MSLPTIEMRHRDVSAPAHELTVCLALEDLDGAYTTMLIEGRHRTELGPLSERPYTLSDSVVYLASIGGQVWFNDPQNQERLDRCQGIYQRLGQSAVVSTLESDFTILRRRPAAANGVYVNMKATNAFATRMVAVSTAENQSEESIFGMPPYITVTDVISTLAHGGLEAYCRGPLQESARKMILERFIGHNMQLLARADSTELA